MKIYIVLAGISYEGTRPFAAFATRKAAEECKVACEMREAEHGFNIRYYYVQEMSLLESAEDADKEPL